MTYLLKNNSKKKKGRFFIILALLIFLFALVLKNPTSSLVHSFVSPIKKTSDFIFSPFENATAYFKSKKSLQSENEKLRDENKKLEIEILSDAALRKENENLRDQLDLKKENQDLKFAEVLLAPPFSPFDTFVLQNNGQIQIGDFVKFKGILLGEVSEKRGENFIATLYSTPGQKIPVRIGTDVIAEAEGQGGVSFRIEIPKDIPITEEDLVYSSSFKNEIIGMVETIETSETSSFKTVRFQYPFNFTDFDFVQIIPKDGFSE